MRSLLNADGTQRSITSYSPYGGVLEQAANWNTTLGFTGEPTDEVGLVYLRARFYNSGSGQFLSSDPLEGQAVDPRSWNGYGYVSGNPGNATDPEGTCAQFLVPILFGIITGPGEAAIAARSGAAFVACVASAA